MRQIDLREYETSAPHQLSVAERDNLREALPSVTIEPVKGSGDRYSLRPGSIVGALEIGGLSVLIRPKIGIPQLLSLACYAMGVYKAQEKRRFDFLEEETLPDTLALALAAAARRAFSQGLLRGYLTQEEALHTVRGRIRFDEQIRRRYGIPLPVELLFDEFTEDILANRLVKAAAARLRHMTLHSSEARRVPEVRFDRLNEHYRHAVGLARLILRHSAFESDRGVVRASGFLMDMNILFQEFVTQALRETLGVSARTLRADSGVRDITLDEEKKVALRPDLSWWDSGVCKFVGDAKYKNITGKSVPNVDLYQMLAYATALDLPGGLLIYAKGEADTATYQVKHTDKRLEVAALDLSGSLDTILERVGDLANNVKALRDEAIRHRQPQIA